MTRKKFRKIAASVGNWIWRKKTVLIILAIYIALCLCYKHYFMTARWGETLKALDGKFGTGFAVSFSASLLEDLIVFLLLTLVVIILTTKSLYEEKFATKIRSILNSEHAIDNDGIFRFLENTISKLVIYDKQADFTLTVVAYDEEQSAFKIFFEQNFIIANMCRDQDYKGRDFTFFVSPADTMVSGDCGHVTLLETFIPGTQGRPVKHVTETRPFKMDKEFSRAIKLSVKRNGQLGINMKFDTWSKTSDTSSPSELKYQNRLKFNRYSENPTVQIVNQLDCGLQFEIFTNHTESKALSLRADGLLFPSEMRMCLEGIEFFPQDDIRVFFHKPDKGQS